MICLLASQPVISLLACPPVICWVVLQPANGDLPSRLLVSDLPFRLLYQSAICPSDHCTSQWSVLQTTVPVSDLSFRLLYQSVICPPACQSVICSPVCKYCQGIQKKTSRGPRRPGDKMCGGRKRTGTKCMGDKTSVMTKHPLGENVWRQNIIIAWFSNAHCYFLLLKWKNLLSVDGKSLKIARHSRPSTVTLKLTVWHHLLLFPSHYFIVTSCFLIDYLDMFIMY